MSGLTEQEQRILALMKELEAAQCAATPSPSAPARPAHPLPERFTDLAFLDRDGRPYPDSRPLPTAEEAAAANGLLIEVLEAQLAQVKAGRPTVPPGSSRRR